MRAPAPSFPIPQLARPLIQELPFVLPGNPTYAAISAVVVANAVLVGYVTVAFREEQAEQKVKALKAGKRE